MKNLNIHADITKAATLPADFYTSADFFAQTKESILARCWHFVAESAVIGRPGDVYPFTLLPGVLDEPLLLTQHTGGDRFCLSNVCTHRGKIIVEEPGNARLLRCGYHGRCFRLDGSFKSMPAFEKVENFPSPADNLTRLPFSEWLGLCFTSLNPRITLEEMTAPIRERCAWMPLDTLSLVEEGTRDYYVNAHWALYCDNFLEGFHIPFVHPALNQAVDFDQYAYEIFPYCNLQIAVAEAGEPHFNVPPGERDHGQQIYAYYWWLFPNLMFNFYPWGLSLNIVEPTGPATTRIRFRTYLFAGTTYQRQINRIDETELEDEAVVESVQVGLRSRFYQQGRFSPAMEQGVHHFHRLVGEWMR